MAHDDSFPKLISPCECSESGILDQPFAQLGLSAGGQGGEMRVDEPRGNDFEVGVAEEFKPFVG